MTTTDAQIEYMENEEAEKLEPTTLTKFIYKAVRNKEEAHEIDQIVRNKLSAYLIDKPETIKALYGKE